MLTDCSPALMKFMGDFPLKGQTEQDLVATILKVHTHTHRGMLEDKDADCLTRDTLE